MRISMRILRLLCVMDFDGLSVHTTRKGLLAIEVTNGKH
jgi:hypothetical protein